MMKAKRLLSFLLAFFLLCTGLQSDTLLPVRVDLWNGALGDSGEILFTTHFAFADHFSDERLYTVPEFFEIYGGIADRTVETILPYEVIKRK